VPLPLLIFGLVAIVAHLGLTQPRSADRFTRWATASKNRPQWRHPHAENIFAVYLIQSASGPAAGRIMLAWRKLRGPRWNLKLIASPNGDTPSAPGDDPAQSAQKPLMRYTAKRILCVWMPALRAFSTLGPARKSVGPNGSGSGRDARRSQETEDEKGQGHTSNASGAEGAGSFPAVHGPRFRNHRQSRARKERASVTMKATMRSLVMKNR